MINLITTYQPVLFILIYSFVYNKKIENWLTLLFIIYIIIHVFNFYNIIKHKLVTIIDKSGKLLWPKSSFQTYILYWIILSIFLYKLYKINIRKTLFILLLVTLFTLWVVYLQKPKTFRSSSGLFSTLWCLFCIYIPIVAYFND